MILNQPQIAERLIEYQADVNIQIKKGKEIGLMFEQPLHFAASRGQHWKAILRVLLKSSDIHIDSKNSEGYFGFYNLTVIQILLLTCNMIISMLLVINVFFGGINKFKA